MSFATRVARLKREHGRPSEDNIVVTIAADFLRGGESTFARAFDRRGSLMSRGVLERLRGVAQKPSNEASHLEWLLRSADNHCRSVS
jgi:hypothetical protein